MPSQQKLGLLVVMAAAIAIAAGVAIWSRTPEWRVLYGNLSDRDGGAIVSALQQMNVPYRFEAGGVLVVPEERVHDARLRLAAQGLPKSSLPGFELMENQKLGTSQFHEQVNYQRALEGELARSIQALSAVQSARVHLALSKPSVFMREQQKPSASVLLNLYAGRTLDAAQVSSIVHLVSSSVPDLPVKNVTVVDQHGNLLSAARGEAAAGALNPEQIKYTREIEQTLVRRVEEILTPVTGPGNVRAQVAAELDFTVSEQTAESWKPNANQAEATIRSQQSSETVSSGAAVAGGVPGALSNQPPAPAVAQVPGSPAPAVGAATPQSSRRDSNVTYEIDKTVRHTRSQAGAIKRLSVAVVVNHRRVVAPDGKVTLVPLSDDEIKKLADLVRETVGFNPDRGDSVNVANAPFQTATPEPVPALPLWQQPETIALAKDIAKHAGILAVVLYLIFGVLRPTLRTVIARPAPAQIEPTLPEAGQLQPPRQVPVYEQKLQEARQLAKEDPKLVANVVRTWVSGDA